MSPCTQSIRGQTRQAGVEFTHNANRERQRFMNEKHVTVGKRKNTIVA